MKLRPLMDAAAPFAVRKPRLGFLGTGWIGRNRLEAIARSELAEIAYVADSDPRCAEEACLLAPGSQRLEDLDALMAADIDGLVIATPSGLHADQAIQALNAGLAVFCQKPLGRNAEEVGSVVAAARQADRLLGLDLSYRFTNGARIIAERIARGDIGRVFAVDLEFHNAYGPDKDWFYDRRLSGGGCVVDLGIHLVDLAFWLVQPSGLKQVTSALYRNGSRLAADSKDVEDFAVVTMETADGVSIRLACSWKLHAGCDAVIGARFFGDTGGLSIRNVNGSFYDLVTHHNVGTRSIELSGPPDDWGGRAMVAWTRQLARDPRYDCACESFVTVANALDRIYDAARR